MSEKFDIHSVLELLPHRYPFLLVDRVIAFEKDKSLTAVKNVTFNEPFFQGHFPTRPVMPGVLVIEAMAQACGLLSARSMGGFPKPGTVYLFVGIDRARFKRPVEPGDQLHLEVQMARRMHNIYKYSAEAKVDGELCASAELMCTYKDFE